MNDKILYIANNFFYLNQIENEYEKIVYCPNVHSNNQKDFFNKRFNELKKQSPRIVKGSIQLNGFSYLLGWDSHYEKAMFKENIIPKQNRLFSHLDFNIPDGFSSFRKKPKK